MNKSNAKDYLPFVIALSEGKTIQFKSPNLEFMDADNEVEFKYPPDFYRIKPELMEFYAIANDDKTDILSTIYKSKEGAQSVIDENKWHHYKIIVHMGEIE